MRLVEITSHSPEVPRRERDSDMEPRLSPLEKRPSKVAEGDAKMRTRLALPILVAIMLAVSSVQTAEALSLIHI